MTYETNHSIWAVIQNAYTNNHQPVIFGIFNLFLLIVIGITLYGAYKWFKHGKDYRLLTLTGIGIFLVFTVFMIVYLTKSDNQVGHYQGEVDIAFTTPIKDSSNAIARFTDGSSSDTPIKAIVMNKKAMSDLGIEAGKTIKVKTQNKPSPKSDTPYIYLEKEDVQDVSESEDILKYNQEQQQKEEKEKKSKEDKKKKDKNKDK